ncbi:head-tail adaptor protein [Bradyrhizobium sp. AZCC 1699]|uniref:head-tail adaptor protein n=1 Tax=Bradyrhizobium sp. AZCC 1699 TaxID=3117024 RepID=UPI002FEEB142
MRAGQLDRSIELQSRATGLDLYGTVIDVWTTFATVRAQVLQYDTSNREGARTTTDTMITFRIYFLDSLTLENRVLCNGQAFKIQKIREIGRRAGLDLVVERVGP